MAADLLMEEGDDESMRRQLMAYLDDPRNADKLEELRIELVMDEQISGEIRLDRIEEPDLGSETGERHVVAPYRPNAIRRGVAGAVRWYARRLRDK